MNSKDYQENVLRTLSDQYFTHRISPDLMHAAIGMCTETGEFLDALKKVLFYGKPLDKVNLVEELGDIMWYVSVASSSLGIDLENIMEININKLKARFPEKFTMIDANNRKLANERNVLEAGVKEDETN